MMSEGEEQVVAEVGPAITWVPHSLKKPYWKDPENMMRK